MVSGRYTRGKFNEIGFDIGVYDKRAELVIDPVLVYSTYYNGALADDVVSIAADTGGNAYVVGTKNSNVFVSKISPDGSTVLYSTSIGPADPLAIAVDAQGSVYIAGEVDSNDFPTVNAYQPKLKGSSAAFVAKLSPSGADLDYSTYFGGDYAYADAIAVDPLGSAYITGYAGLNLPVVTPLSSGLGAYLAKFSPSGSSLDYSTYIAGSSQSDTGYAIAVDPWG